MKPRIIHVLDDQNLGGVAIMTRYLCSSRLRDEFDFAIMPTQAAILALKTRPDSIAIVHNPSAWRRLPHLATIKRYAHKVILIEHHYSAGFEQWKVPHPRRFHAMLKVSYGLADHIIAVSEGQAHWLRQHHLVPPHKLTKINPCAPIDTLLTVAAKEIQRPLMLSAYGRFDQQKGFDVLLKAMRLLPDSPIRLNLGGYGADEAMLKQLAIGLANVKFWGTIQDKLAFLAAADVVIMPSRWEPWGMVCVEAKAAGKPIIASDIDGLSEQIQDCGRLVAPDQPEQLAAAIQQITTLPPQTLVTWGQNARRSVFNAWDIYLDQWRSFLLKRLEQ